VIERSAAAPVEVLEGRAPRATGRPAGSSFAGVFDVVAVGAVRRRPSDVTRFVVWLLVLVLASLTADDRRPWGATLADLVGAIPDVVQPTLSSLYRWGTIAVVVVAVGTALVRRRWRFALALAGTVALVLLIGLWLVDGLDPGSRGVGASPYPAVRVAVAVGVVIVAGPYVTRPLRRVLVTVVAVAWVGALTSGDALVVDGVGGVALGGAAAALVHLLVGSPAGTPSLEQIRRSLAARGVAVDRLELAGRQVWGETQLVATLADGSVLDVSVVGRDATDARLLAKLWRSVWYRDAGVQVSVTRAAQVEHQAFVLMWAALHDVPVPRLVTAGVGGSRADALLVAARPPGRPWAELIPSSASSRPGPAEDGSASPGPSGLAAPAAVAAVGAVLHHDVLDDDVLDRAWVALRALHDAGLAHGRLDPAALLVDDRGGVAFTDVSHASTDPPPSRQALDGVALLVASAAVVGDARAVAAARRALGDDGLAALLRMVSVAALPAVDARHRGTTKARCTSVREAGAAALGVAVPEPEELRRIRPTDIVLTVGTLVGAYLLIGQLADLGAVWDTFTSATIGWVVLTAVVTQLTSVSNGVALIGSVSHQELPLRHTTALQFANKFTGLVGGTVANLALFTRYLQKRGLGVATAASSAALTSISQFVAQTGLFIVAFLVARGDFTSRVGGDDGGDGIDLGTVLVAIIVVGVLVGVAVGVPQVRTLVGRVLRPQWQSAKVNILGVVSTPRRAVLLLGGYLASQLLFALGLSFALRAYGYELSLLDFVVVNTVASLLGGLAPVPGGMGVIEAGLVAGLTAAGIPDDAAVAATFTYRAFTAYLPPIWGWASLAWLRTRDLV
jgi:uncharacterized membrane protein YbhN (UPF0104 family)